MMSTKTTISMTDDEYYEDDYEEKPRRSLFGKKNAKEDDYDDFDMGEDKKSQPASNKVTPMRPAPKTGRQYGSLRSKTDFCG